MQRGAQELAKEVSRTKGVAVAMEIAAQGLAEGMDMAAGLLWYSLVKRLV